MNTKESAAIFIEKLKEYDLKISKINKEVCEEFPENLYDRILSEESVDLTFDIDNQEFSIKISIDEDTAIVVYDYHEVFDDIAEDIRLYHAIVDGD